METKLIFPQFQSSLGFFGIIRESIKTTSKNGKLVVLILLFVFLSFSQLYFGQEYILAPVTKHVLLELANHPNMVQDFTYNIDQSSYVPALNDIREILVVKLLIMAISSIITLVFLIATVSSSSEAYIAKVLGLKDIFLNIKKSWKRPIVTSFYMILLSLGIGFLYMISIGIFSILAVNSWALLFLGGAIALSTPVCYFYVTSLWMVSMIVSVLEDVSGLKAIGRAAELMKGKRLQASFMMVLFCIAYGFILLMASFLNQSLNAEMAITIMFTNGFYCLLKLFMFVVYTVFYHEWKTSHDEKEGKGFYIPVTAGEA